MPGERLRLDLYRRLADVKNPLDVESIRAELLDPVLVNEVLSIVRDLKSDGMTMC